MSDVLRVSYSKLFDAPQVFNSAEMYTEACQLGFDAIKGDVAVTSDNKLVMCHDSYFLFDDDGRVFASDELEGVKGNLPAADIVDMTYAACVALEYRSPSERERLGYYPKVVGLEDYLKICKEYGKIAYITVRDLRIPAITQEIYQLLVQYDMVEQCIVNSFAYETLTALRALDDRLFISQVQPPDTIPTKEILDAIAALGKAAVCYFWFGDSINDAMYERARDSIAYAKEKGLAVHLAHAWSKEGIEIGVQHGFTGFQCGNACVF